MTQLSIGFQAGGKAYSEIIFFQESDTWTNSNPVKFEFAAGASAVAITAGASASIGTDRASSGASRGKDNATTNGDYQSGMAAVYHRQAASCSLPIFPARSLLTRTAGEVAYRRKGTRLRPKLKWRHSSACNSVRSERSAVQIFILTMRAFDRSH